MINKIEYKLLKLIKQKKVIKTQNYLNQLRSLANNGYIQLCAPERSSSFSLTYHGCYITQKGTRAYEEYKHHIINIWLSIVGITVAIISAVLTLISIL